MRRSYLSGRWVLAVLVPLLCQQGLFGQVVVSPPAVLNTNASADAGEDVSVKLASDGSGTWIVVWHSNDDLGGAIGADNDVLFARSTDDGATWSAPAALNTNAASDGGAQDVEPTIMSSGAGNWLASWREAGGTIGTGNDILVAQSTDNGVTWSSPTPLNTVAGQNPNPPITSLLAPEMDVATGMTVLVWHSNDDLAGTIGTDDDIFVATSTNGGASWTVPAFLNTSATADTGLDQVPVVASGGGNVWIVVWHSDEDLGAVIGTDEDILLARSVDNAATWSVPAVLNTNASADSGLDVDPAIAADGLGNVVVVWHSNDDLGGSIGVDNDILVASSSDNGSTWSAPAALNTTATVDGTSPDVEPSIITDDNGTWLVAWREVDGTIGTGNDILVAQSTDNGATWSDPVPLNTPASSPFLLAPQIGRSSGTNLVVWQSADDFGGTVGTDDDLFYAGVDATSASPIPAASEWGLGVMSLLILTAGTFVFRHRRSHQATALSGDDGSCA